MGFLMTKARKGALGQPPLFEMEKSCATCPLNAEEKNLEHPKMLPTGSDKEGGVYILGEAPDANEDAQGEQFIGKAGTFLRVRLPGWIKKDLRWNNTIRCRPPDNRTPTEQEIACCSRLQVEDIEKHRPRAIFGFGATPLRWAVPTADQITAWRGMRIPIRVGTHVCWFFPMLHPSYVMRKQNDKRDGEAMLEIFEHDIREACAFVKEEVRSPRLPKPEDAKRGVTWQKAWGEEGLREIEQVLDGFEGEVSIDLETTGIRPYMKDTRILSVAVGTWTHCYAFCLDHRESKWTKKERAQLLKMLWKFLTSGKTIWAHNAKFELEWLLWLFKDPGILFHAEWNDTMVQSHILNEQWRKSLEDRCMATMAINVKALTSVNVKALDLEPLDKVLEYNALDTKYCHQLARLQGRQLMDEKLHTVYVMQTARPASLAWMQSKGWIVDPDKVQEYGVKLTAEQQEVELRIARNKDVRAWERQSGRKFNPASNADVPEFFRDFLRRKEGYRGDKYSTDEEVLSNIKHPVAAAILELRGVSKLLSTYIAPFRPGGKHIHADGLVHPNFNQFGTETGRLASDDPNGQNFPKRGGKKHIRNIMSVGEGELMVAIDFGQIEARVIAMASEDRRLVSSLWEGYDIHQDWAKRISKDFPYVLDPFEKEGEGDDAKILKLFRSDVKNVWTFPLFFGSQLESVAKALKIPAHKLRHLYAAFWDEFAGVKKWQKRLLSFYEEHKYVELLTGKRRHGPLTLNQIINSPIQGTASDIVVDGMTRLSELAYRKNRPQLQAIKNVHDDLTFRFPKATVEQDIETAASVMTTCSFSFINVPLTVEVSVGTHWGDLEDIAVFDTRQFKEE
jgi:uracil-DNA glycosylase family 4